MRKSSRFVALFLVILLGACGSNRSTLPPVMSGTVNDQASSNQEDYRIGPGDVLDIFVWRNPDISTTVPVRPDGKISTPLVEDMVAVGKTASELARDMEAVLGTYIKSPSVNVIVTEFRGTFEGQVRVVGQAANPQSVPYREGMTMLDLIIAVGGLSEFAAGNRAKLVRKVDGQIVEYKVRLDDLLNKGEMRHNVAIRAGDVLIIPESFF